MSQCQGHLLITTIYQAWLRFSYLLATTVISRATGIELTNAIDRRLQPSDADSRAPFRGATQESTNQISKTTMRAGLNLAARMGANLPLSSAQPKRWKSTRMTVPTELDASD